MNVETVAFNLGEASRDLENLAADIRAGKLKSDDESALAARLGHILDHLNWSWNCKEMSIDQVTHLPTEEFVRLSNTVPNFQGERVIGEFAA